MNDVDKLSVKNWTEFQHYKERTPPWIKLHRNILDDYDFACLPVASQALAPRIWLLASESADGSIPNDPPFLSFRLRMTEKQVTDALKPLIDKGFLTCASDMLAPRKQQTRLEEEGETEAETEEEGEETPPIKPDAVRNLFNAKFPNAQQAITLNDSRRNHLKARIREGMKTEKDWEDYFDIVSQSPFLTGRVPPRSGYKQFQLSLDYVINPTNYLNICEGKYHD